MKFWPSPAITPESASDEVWRKLLRALETDPGPFVVTIRTLTLDHRVQAHVQAPAFVIELASRFSAARTTAPMVYVRYEQGQPDGVFIDHVPAGASQGVLFLNGRFWTIDRSPCRVGRGPVRHGQIRNDVVLPQEHGWVRRDAFDLHWNPVARCWELSLRVEYRGQTVICRGGNEFRLQKDGFGLAYGDVIRLIGPEPGVVLDLEYRLEGGST